MGSIGPAMGKVKRYVALAAVLMVAFAGYVSPVGAERASGPVAHASSWPQTADVTVPGPGDATVVSSTLPATATQATIDAQPQATTDAKTFGEITAVVVGHYPKLGKLSKRAQGILSCILMSAVISTWYDSHALIVDNDPLLQLLYLHECLRIALQLTMTHAQNAASSASAVCFQTGKAIGITVTRSSSGYRGVASGRTHKPSGPSPLVVSCQRNGNGVRLTVRPRVRGRTLQQVVGPSLGIGFANAGTKPVGVRATLAVR
jgi:hypothetical protein